MTKTAEIYSFLKSLGRPSQLPGRWHCLSQADSPFFYLGLEFEAIVDQLRVKFSEQELRKAGVLQQGPDQSWQLRPSLQGSHLLLLHPQRNPFMPQLVTATEVLPQGGAPYQTLLQDRRLFQLLQKNSDENDNWHYLAITPTLAETAIFWRLGLPAVPLASLTELDAAGLETLQRLLTGIRPVARPRDETSKLSLVLVTCSLATWDFNVQPKINAVSELLRDLQNVLGLDLRTVLWRPGHNARKCLDTALRFQAVEKLRKAILFGYERETTVLALKKQVPYETHDEPLSYADTVSAWVANRNLDCSQQELLLKQLAQSSNRQLILPLLQLAERTEDPVIVSLLVTLSHVCRSLEFIAVRLFSPVPRHIHPHQDQSERKGLREEQQALIKQQTALCQAISDRSRNTARPQATA